MACKTVCNVCGKEFDIYDKQEDFTIERHVGYGSKYDGELVSLHMCCDCMDKLIDSCRVKPLTESVDEPTEEEIEYAESLRAFAEAYIEHRRRNGKTDN